MASRPSARLFATALVVPLLLGGVAHAAAAAPTAPAAADPEAEVSEEAPAPARDVSYGAAARLRWVSVPSWLLGLFTKNNVPLSSWGTGLELFRRTGNFDFALSFNYVDLSPPDGNWLGSSADPATEVNFVHFDRFAMYAFDASFYWHTFFTPWFGLRYGAGFGFGIVAGHIDRTVINGGECNAQNITTCRATMGEMPMVSGSVPPAVPILNVDVGVEFRIPQVKGLEFRLDGGFYDTFFLGGGVGYAF